MKLYLTDIDFDWNSSEYGRVPLSKQEEILDNFLAYEFDLDLPDDSDYEDVLEELKWEISRMTDLDIRVIDYELS